MFISCNVLCPVAVFVKSTFLLFAAILIDSLEVLLIQVKLFAVSKNFSSPVSGGALRKARLVNMLLLPYILI